MFLQDLFDNVGDSSVSGRGGRVTAVLQAWKAGLMECLPAALRHRIVRADTRLELQVDADRAIFWLKNPGGAERLGETRRDDPSAIRELLARGRRKEARLVVVAPATSVLVRRVYFPAQVKDNLRRVLEYEMDRLTPFAAPDLYFDYRTLPVRAREQVGVELACMPKGGAAAWLETLNAQGETAASLSWEGAWRGANLLPVGMRTATGGRGRWLDRVLWAGVLVLAAAVLVTPLWQKREIVIELGERMDKAQRAAERVSTIRGEVDQAVKSANFVLEQKRSAHNLVELLRVLSELIPDHTWVYQLDYQNGTVQIRGDSAQATSLIEILAREPAFRNVGFRSPVVAVPNTDRERFHLSFDFAKAGSG